VNTVTSVFITHNGKPEHGGQRGALILGDGSRISIQASDGHYCWPRESGRITYEEVEVGFPKHADGTPWNLETECPEFKPFEDYPGSQVYGYVPMEVVEAVVKRHGGVMRPC
jgi:hypothetical protein